MIIIYKTTIIEKKYNSEEVSEVKCDKCGKDIILEKDNTKERYVDITIKTKNTYSQSDYSEHNQLCNNCARELYKWFNYKIENDKHYASDIDYIDPKDDIDKD